MEGVGSLGRLMNPAMDIARKMAEDPNQAKEFGKANGFPELDTRLVPDKVSELNPIDATGNAGTQFGSMLKDLVNDVSAKSATAKDNVEGVLAGENIPLHQAMISIQEASVSFQLMVEVRNKLLESYQELMRMQV